MFTFVLVLQAIVAAILVGVILMQRSEGGGLGTGGSPAGLMSARGAADFLTRTTAILAGVFVTLSILLAVLAAMHHSTTIDSTLAKPVLTQPQIPVGGTPPALGQGGSAAAAAALGANTTAPAPASNGAVPVQN
ncbi:MAG: preprotein translocase subunit SecG [Sphingomonas sp.]